MRTLVISFCLLGLLLPDAALGQRHDYVKEKKQAKELVLDDYVYEQRIRSVQLYPRFGQPSDQLQIALAGLGTNQDLMLEFDEVGTDYYNYYMRIVPCNWDWSQGMLQDMEIVEGYNEFIMDGYELSSGTRVPYVHYHAALPRVKLSGNYVLVVYRSGNRDDIILSRRFMIYENLVQVPIQVSFAAGVEQRFASQQVNFQIQYEGYNIINPMQSVNTVIRQNYRWDNAITNLRPLFIREESLTLDYSYFSLENAFPGGNEWRSFDIRSLRYRGFGVEAVGYNNNEADARLFPDGSRNLKNYSQFVDQNGRYAIAKAEADDEDITADYVNTTFTYVPGVDKPEGKIYITGQLTDYQLLPQNELRPDSSGKRLTVTLPLKQGLYSYGYGVLAPGKRVLDLVPTEGSYSLTENVYEVLVYYRPIGARYDQLCGYARTDYNGRN